MTHIQNTAPGPPIHRAVDTPMMFPVPTREAVETIRAPKEETAPSVAGFSDTTRMDSGNSRSWGTPVHTVKYSPPQNSSSARGQPVRYSRTS